MRPLIPLPGLTEDETRALSRQMRYKLRRATSGLCTQCAKPAEGNLCASCLAVHRERMRQRTGAVRRNIRSKSYVAVDPSNSPIPVAPTKKARGKSSKTSRPKRDRAAKTSREET